MLYNRALAAACYSALFLVISGGRVSAQTKPWDLFSDAHSTSVCDVVNAASTELVVLTNTWQLVVVTGPDVTLADTFVDEFGSVFFEGEPAGLIDFAEDGDGLRSLWWLTLTGTVVDIDAFTAKPSDSGLFPTDFVNVPCDACDFWDDQSVCDPVTIRICGTGVPIAMSLIALGLFTLRFVHMSSRSRRTLARISRTSKAEGVCHCFRVAGDGSGIERESAKGEARQLAVRRRWV